MKNDWKRKLGFGTIVTAGVVAVGGFIIDLFSSNIGGLNAFLISVFLILHLAEYLKKIIDNYHSGKKLLGE